MLNDTIELNILKGLEHYHSKFESSSVNPELQNHPIHKSNSHFPQPSCSLPAEKGHKNRVQDFNHKAYISSHLCIVQETKYSRNVQIMTQHMFFFLFFFLFFSFVFLIFFWRGCKQKYIWHIKKLFNKNNIAPCKCCTKLIAYMLAP